MEPWRKFESLVERIYRSLSPGATVRASEQIQGKSGATRKIDVSIRTHVAGQDLLVIVDAKLQRKPVSMEKVSAFAGQVADVRASKGVMISNSGFTAGARKVATDLGIDLCEAIDASSRPWQHDLSVPVIFQEFEVEFDIHATSEPFDDRVEKLKAEWVQVTLVRADDETPVSWPDLVCQLWNEGAMDRTRGQHAMQLPAEEYTVKLGRELKYPIRVQINYHVTRRDWLKRLRPDDCLGIASVLTKKGEVRGTLDMRKAIFNRDSTWQLVEDLDSLSFREGSVIRATAKFTSNNVAFDGGNHRITR